MCNATNQPAGTTHVLQFARSLEPFQVSPKGRGHARSRICSSARGINIENPFSVPPGGRQAADRVDGASDMPRI
jgi:hypothetical protein